MWASFEVTLLVKNLPTGTGDIVDTSSTSPGLGRCLEEKMQQTHSASLGSDDPINRGVWWARVHQSHKELDTTEQLSTQEF